MPRRPRPASRTPQSNGRKEPPSFHRLRGSITQKKNSDIPNKRKLEDVGSDDDSDSDGGDDDEGSHPAGPGSGIEEDYGVENDDDEEVDIDAPRVAQWVDEEELEEIEGEDDEDIEAGEEPNIDRLEDDLFSLPLGALRRAQRVLAQAEPDSDSDSPSEDGDAAHDDGSDEENSSAPHEISTKEEEKSKQKVEWSIERRTDIAKRANKHAPTEVSSKRPVTRKRQIVPVAKVEPRDPRFLALGSSQFSSTHFSKEYSFLSKSRQDELQTLKTSLARAQKLLANSPQDLREERQTEVQRLEQAVRRIEGIVRRDKREEVERTALEKVEKEEKAKRKEGKKGWWMKDSEKKNLLAKARLEAIEAEGGKKAVKKAVEKKQKKVGQKEKKSRPWAPGKGGGDDGDTRPGERWGGGTGRRPVDAGYPTSKRRKVV